MAPKSKFITIRSALEAPDIWVVGSPNLQAVTRVLAFAAKNRFWVSIEDIRKTLSQKKGEAPEKYKDVGDIGRRIRQIREGWTTAKIKPNNQMLWTPKSEKADIYTIEVIQWEEWVKRYVNMKEKEAANRERLQAHYQRSLLDRAA